MMTDKEIVESFAESLRIADEADESAAFYDDDVRMLLEIIERKEQKIRQLIDTNPMNIMPDVKRLADKVREILNG